MSLEISSYFARLLEHQIVFNLRKILFVGCHQDHGNFLLAKANSILIFVTREVFATLRDASFAESKLMFIRLANYLLKLTCLLQFRLIFHHHLPEILSSCTIIKLPSLLLLCFCPLIVIAFVVVSRNFIETFLLSVIELLSADDGYTVRANLRFVLWVGFKFPKQCFVIRWIHVQTFLRSQFIK